MIRNVLKFLILAVVFGYSTRAIFAQPRYAKMTDTVFHVGDLIQHRYEQRFSLGPHFKTKAQMAGIEDSDSVRMSHFLELVSFIKSHPELILEIGSHTDWRGNATSNIELSQRRTQALVDFMIREYSIDSTQVKAVGYGREKPRTMFSCNGSYWVYPDDSLSLNCEETPEFVTLTNDYINQFKATKGFFERLHQFNRRVEVKIIGIRE